MVDFHGIQARHFQIFQEYAARCQEIVQPVLRTAEKIAGIKRLSVAVQEAVLQRKALLPRGLIGQRINIIV